ncbi:hypothetical protein PENTCL1PPCAC_11742, partial [Pristionchus entomophagus]
FVDEASIMIHSTTVLLAILAGSATVRADYCPQSINSQIQACVLPVGEYAKMLNSNQSSRSSEISPFSLPNMGSKVFHDLCKLVKKFNDCVKDLRRTCPRHVTIGLIDSSYGYLCHDGYHTFLDSAECLMELDRKPEVKTCHDQTLRDIERANGNAEMGLNEKVDKMCSALNFFSGCVKHPIRNECGVAAWQVIHRVLKDTTKTLMPGCVFGRSTSTTPPAVIENGEIKSHHLAHHSSPDHSESRHSEIRSHGTRAGRRKTTTTTEATTTGGDFVVGTSEDEVLRGHLRDSTLISTDATSDYYQLPSSTSSISPSLFCLLVLVTIRIR